MHANQMVSLLSGGGVSGAFLGVIRAVPVGDIGLVACGLGMG